jgi:hypothetical protein
MPDDGGKQDARRKKELSWFITFDIERAQEFLVLSRSSPCQVRPWWLRLDLDVHARATEPKFEDM